MSVSWACLWVPALAVLVFVLRLTLWCHLFAVAGHCLFHVSCATGADLNCVPVNDFVQRVLRWKARFYQCKELPVYVSGDLFAVRRVEPCDVSLPLAFFCCLLIFVLGWYFNSYV